MITMSVIYLYDLMADEVFNQKWGGNPTGEAGEIVELPFTLGAHLIAAGYAEAVPEENIEDVPEVEEDE